MYSNNSIGTFTNRGLVLGYDPEIVKKKPRNYHGDETHELLRGHIPDPSATTPDPFEDDRLDIFGQFGGSVPTQRVTKRARYGNPFDVAPEISYQTPAGRIIDFENFKDKCLHFNHLSEHEIRLAFNLSVGSLKFFDSLVLTADDEPVEKLEAHRAIQRELHRHIECKIHTRRKWY